MTIFHLRILLFKISVFTQSRKTDHGEEVLYESENKYQSRPENQQLIINQVRKEE
jgi:hypothetical protein